jgi:phosphate starvation-inducible protein PhoH
MAAQQRRMTKREKRVLKQQGVLDENANLNFTVRKDISPKTENQAIAFGSWKSGYNVFLHGIAGTGKTFLALYFAFHEVFKRDTDYKKVYIIRSTVSTRNQGFMPGSQKQKEAVYEEPYPPICADIFGRDDAYHVLKQKNKVEFRSTSFLRGVTFDNCIIVVDEVQNLSDGELHTIMTRVGENTRIIFAGDIKQDDLTSERFNEKSGIASFMRIINNMDEFDFIEFYADDIVRSKLVKSYIIERDRLGL